MKKEKKKEKEKRKKRERKREKKMNDKKTIEPTWCGATRDEWAELYESASGEIIDDPKVQYAVMIDTEHTVRVIPILLSDVLTCLYNRIGCTSIEAVHWGFPHLRGILVVDESGKLNGLPRNDVATDLYDSEWDYIAGNAVICRAGSEDFEFMSYDDAVDLAENLCYVYHCSLRD